MRKNKRIIFVSLMAFLLAVFSACDSSDDSTLTTETRSQTKPVSNKNTTENSKSTDKIDDNQNFTKKNDHKDDSNTETDQTNEKTSNKGKDMLSQFSSKQIEYARIWSQLGPNQQIDELYVRHISAGEPINPIDETSEVYPTEVIQLSGSRLVDGSVTYSGNGDGTINVYNVSLRWDGQYPAGESFYKDIIQNTDLVSVDAGDEKEIVKLIKLITIHHD